MADSLTFIPLSDSPTGSMFRQIVMLFPSPLDGTAVAGIVSSIVAISIVYVVALYVQMMVPDVIWIARALT